MTMLAHRCAIAKQCCMPKETTTKNGQDKQLEEQCLNTAQA